MVRRGEKEAPEHKPIEGQEVRMSEGGSSEVTVVGQGARLEGTVLSAGFLRIDGEVKGKITADGDLVLSAQSQVDADINATNVTVAGKFKGNITAKGKAEVAKGGRVDGNITSKTLVVSEGAIFHGQSIMDQQAGQAGTGVGAVTAGAAASAEASKSDSGQAGSTPSKAEKARARS